nr:PspC domain-containing protein [Blautia wexlerae]
MYCSRKGKIFFGVCGGLAKCFNVDAKIVRLLFTVMVFVFPKIIIAYIILMIVIPKEVKIR